MPSKVTIETAESVFLEARAAFEDWQEEIAAEFYQPVADTAARLLWSRQPEQVKAKLREITPDAAGKLDKLLGGA